MWGPRWDAFQCPVVPLCIRACPTAGVWAAGAVRTPVPSARASLSWCVRGCCCVLACLRVSIRGHQVLQLPQKPGGDEESGFYQVL